MGCLLDFYRGFFWNQVNWYTRHRSRSYSAGMAISSALMIAAPFAFCFGLGFWVGRVTS